MLRTWTAAAALACATASTASANEPRSLGPADAPPKARPGECYARLLGPDRVETYTEKVLVQKERVERRETPPQYAPERRSVVVGEETRRVVDVPPVYETVTETILVRPGSEQRVVEPAEVRIVREAVAVEPDRMVWKLVHPPHQPAPIWCLVAEPGRSAVVEREVVIRPETVRVVATPPEYKTVSRQVLKAPGYKREEVVPPQTKEVVIDRLISPGRVEEIKTPPVYKDVTKTRTVPSTTRVWTPVLCETAATPHRIKSLQSALARRGYYKGPADGLYGLATADAVKRFQADRGLPHEGFLSRPTFDALGVPFGPVPTLPTRLGPTPAR